MATKITNTELLKCLEDISKNNCGYKYELELKIKELNQWTLFLKSVAQITCLVDPEVISSMIYVHEEDVYIIEFRVEENEE